jgi:hypothetical protein
MFYTQLSRKDNPWWQLLYEVGFALVVSAVVSAIYELHERVQYEERALKGVLKGVIDELVVPGVWDAIHEQIVDKHIFRQDAVLKISLSPPDNFRYNLQKLRVTLSYNLFAARPTPRKSTVRHQLNFHLHSEKDGFPRFERIVFGRHNLIGQNLAKHVSQEGVFSMQWDPVRDGNPIEISVERVELTNVPGSYYFTFLELTQGVRIEVDALPEGIEGEICALPDTKPYKMIQDEIVERRTLILPGQSIEFRFTEKKTESSRLVRIDGESAR